MFPQFEKSLSVSRYMWDSMNDKERKQFLDREQERVDMEVFETLRNNNIECRFYQ